MYLIIISFFSFLSFTDICLILYLYQVCCLFCQAYNGLLSLWTQKNSEELLNIILVSVSSVKSNCNNKKKLKIQAVVAYNSRTEAGGSLSSRPAWSTDLVPVQPGLYREIMSWERKNKTRKQQKYLKNQLKYHLYDILLGLF